MTTNTHTLLVSFIASSDKFIVKPNEIGALIKKEACQGINFIKIFNPNEDKFVSCKKSKVADICSYNTEASIELAKFGYKPSSID